MNGQRGTITTVHAAARTVTVDWDGRTPTVVPAGYLDAGHLDHGYAITGHRAQGLTVDRTWIQTSDTLYREWGYVAASRGRHHNQLYTTTDSIDPVADDLDHGAWQPTTATPAQRPLVQCLTSVVGCGAWLAGSCVGHIGISARSIGVGGAP